MKKTLLLILLAVGHTVVNAQIISLAPNNVFAVCPNEQITYSASMTNNSLCNYQWQITGGTFSGGGTTATGTSVTVTWNSSATSGTLKLTTVSCALTVDNNQTETKPFAIKSLAGANLGSIGGASSVNVNITTSIRYTIPLIQYPKGSSDPDPFYVTGYEWQVPAGWTITNTNYSVSNVQAYIDVTPDGCTGGTIRARAKSSCGNFYSNWSNPITITRTVATPGAISGPNFVVCSDTAPVPFSVPAVTGATSYLWTFPSGWSGTSTTNSITLTPNGTNGGNVTVKAVGCNLQSNTASVKPVSLELFNPSIPPTSTGPSVIPCTGATFTLNNVPAGATVTWLASPGYFQTNSGSGTSASLIPADFSTGGSGTVTFSINTACGNPIQVQSNEFLVQGLLGPIYFTNSENDGMYFCSSSYGNYFEIDAGAPGTNFEARLLDITGQTVLYTSSTTTYQAGVPNLWTYYPPSNGYYVFEVRGTNACGSTSWFGTEVEYVDCSWLFNVYPNPADKYVDIAMLDSGSKMTETESYQITLVDDTGTEVLKTSSKRKKQRVDTSHLKKGEYILRIQYNGEVTVRRIVINR